MLIFNCFAYIFNIFMTVCATAVDNPSDGAPDTPDPHHGGVHHTSCGSRESCYLYTLDKQGIFMRKLNIFFLLYMIFRL